MPENNSNPQDRVEGKYHLEISQSVQNMENSIPLIRDKRAYARAYFDHNQVDEKAKGVYRAHLHLASPSSTFTSLNSMTLDPGNPVSRDRQRLNWDQSFNFDLNEVRGNTRGQISAGELELEIISNSQEGSLPRPRLSPDADSSKFTVEPSPFLKVTCLLLRYWNAETEDYVMPDPVQVDAIRDFVVSAFPVAENNVEWNTITVQATDEFRSLSKLTKARPDAEEAASLAMRELLLQTTVHRNMDTYTNPDTELEKDWPNTHDIRTIYLAVFDDPSDQLGGAATDSPTFPVHNIAGAAVVDLSGQIGAHELAHILGREHPGVPWRKKYGPYLGQRIEDEELKKKYKKSGKEYMGFLNVESVTTQGLHVSRQFNTPRIYEPNLYFDLMTYRDPQWLSDYSYRGIKERLDKLYQYGKKTPYTTDRETRVVIGEYDLNRQTGRILFVLPTRYKGLDLQLSEYEPPNPKKSGDLPSGLDTYKKITDSLQIKLLCSIEVEAEAEAEEPIEFKVYHRLSNNTNSPGEKQRDMPNFGIFQATVESDKLEKIELQVAGNIVDVFKARPKDASFVYFTLLNALVDSLKDNTEDELQKTTRIEHPARYMKINKNQALLFYYDVIEDEYYLRFNWLAVSKGNGGEGVKKKDLLDSKMISTIQCKRPGCNEWVTVIVSSRRKGNAWISPDLVNREEYSTDPEFSDKAFYSHLSKTTRGLESISNDSIEFRILFSAGFDKAILPPVTTTAKIYFPTEFLQNQEDRHEGRDYLDSNKPSSKNLRNRSGKHRPMY